MVKSKKFFILWGVIVGIIIILLIVLCFMLKGRVKGYTELENKLKASAVGYIDIHFLYPEAGKTAKVTSKELIANELLTDFKYENEECDGYVIVSNKNGIYDYKSYISCGNYTTRGYQK